MYILRDSSAAYSYTMNPRAPINVVYIEVRHRDVFCTQCFFIFPRAPNMVIQDQLHGEFLNGTFSFMSSYRYAGLDVRTTARVPFSNAEEESSFQLQMDITFRVKWNFTQVEHLSFITRCAFFLYQFLRSNEIPLNTNLRFSRTKNVVDCETSG